MQPRLSLRLKDLLGPVTRVKKKQKTTSQRAGYDETERYSSQFKNKDFTEM